MTFTEADIEWLTVNVILRVTFIVIFKIKHFLFSGAFAINKSAENGCSLQICLNSTTAAVQLLLFYLQSPDNTIRLASMCDSICTRS